MWRGRKLEVITILAVTPLLLRVASCTSTLKGNYVIQIQIQKKTKIHKSIRVASCLNFERKQIQKIQLQKGTEIHKSTAASGNPVETL